MQMREMANMDPVKKVRAQDKLCRSVAAVKKQAQNRIASDPKRANFLFDMG